MELRGLREARYREALTQEELAKRAGLSKQTINSLERGKSRARPSTIRKLAEALGVWPAELIDAPTDQPRRSPPQVADGSNYDDRDNPTEESDR